MLFAWTLFVGAWLVLGSLGRSTSALRFAGLGPVAAWLAVAGLASAFSGVRGPSPRGVAIAVLVTVGGLVLAIGSGSGAAPFVAAAGWGVLSCAASRHARAGRDIAFVPGCVPLPRSLGDAARWPALGARWAMLPMMAALALESDWCAGLGLSTGQGIALHLAAMFAPPALVRLAPPLRSLASPLWIAAFMAGGLAMLPLVPGVRGWMAMSLLHAIAWGLAWSQDVARAPASPPRRGDRTLASTGFALSPAAALLALGGGIAAFGLQGLIAVHVALGALSLGGAAAWIVAGARRHAHPGHDERPA